MIVWVSDEFFLLKIQAPAKEFHLNSKEQSKMIIE